MNDTQALFSRLLALAAYFEGTNRPWAAEEVFSPRAILAEGRVAPTERIRAAEPGEGGHTPYETILALLQRTASGTFASAARQQSAPMTLMPNRAAEGGFLPLQREAAAQALDAEALSRAFSRDARRYDE